MCRCTRSKAKSESQNTWCWAQRVFVLAIHYCLRILGSDAFIIDVFCLWLHDVWWEGKQLHSYVQIQTFSSLMNFKPCGLWLNHSRCRHMYAECATVHKPQGLPHLIHNRSANVKYPHRQWGGCAWYNTVLISGWQVHSKLSNMHNNKIEHVIMSRCSHSEQHWKQK